MSYQAKYSKYTYQNQVMLNDAYSVGLFLGQDNIKHYQWEIRGQISEQLMEELLQNTFDVFPLMPIIDYQIEQSVTYLFTPCKQTLRQFLSTTQINQQQAYQAIQQLIVIIFDLHSKNITNLRISLDTVFVIGSHPFWQFKLLHFFNTVVTNHERDPIFFTQFNNNQHGDINQLGRLWYYLVFGQSYFQQLLHFPQFSILNNIQRMLQQNRNINEFLHLVQNFNQGYHIQAGKFQGSINTYKSLKDEQGQIEVTIPEQYDNLTFKNSHEAQEIYRLIQDIETEYSLSIQNLQINIRERKIMGNSQELLNSFKQNIRKIGDKINTANLKENLLKLEHQVKLNEWKNHLQQQIDKIDQLIATCENFHIGANSIRNYRVELILAKNSENVFEENLQYALKYEELIQQLRRSNKIQEKEEEILQHTERLVRNIFELHRNNFEIEYQSLKEKLSNLIVTELENFDLSSEPFYLQQKYNEVNQLKQSKIQQLQSEIPLFAVEDISMSRDLSNINSRVVSFSSMIKNQKMRMINKINQVNLIKNELTLIGIYQPKNNLKFTQHYTELKEKFNDQIAFELAMIVDEKEEGYKDQLKLKLEQIFQL